jgi:hypothetical protein
VVADQPALQLSDVKKELDELEQRLNKRIDEAADRIMQSLMDQLDCMRHQIREQMDELRRVIRHSIQREHDAALRGDTLHLVPETSILASGDCDSVTDDPEEIWNRALKIIRAHISSEGFASN